jgi:ceramide glucosyltransferase
MAHNFITIFAVIAGGLALCGCGYYVLCIWSAYAFMRTVPHVREANVGLSGHQHQTFTPPVSFLKPLRGADREMYEAFRSHCLQDYPEFEIVFGVSVADDPAIALVERLKQEFPERRIELVFCRENLGANIKVSNLVQMLPHAHYDHLLINDSDIRIAPDHLRRVMSPLADAKVGMVTTLYRGAAGHTLGSRLEALGISTDFAAGVLSARVVEGGIHFGLGSTLAIKRDALNAIGGFEPLLDYLADDYELGNRIGNAGYEVILSDEVVDTLLPDYHFRDYWRHQLRWMRSVRASRGWGYLGLLLTFGMPFALIAAIVARGAPWSLALLGVAALTRFVMAYVTARRVMRDRAILRQFWLIPLRDVFALAIWAAGYFSNSVVWRGDEFTLKKGKLARIENQRAAHVARP